MKRWIGRWLMAVAVVHIVYAFIAYRGPFRAMMDKGLLDSVGTDPVLAEAAWFLLCGPVFFMLGLTIDHIEKSGVVPKSIGWGLLIFGILGATLMPAGGFWLFFPPALFIFLRASRRGSGSEISAR